MKGSRILQKGNLPVQKYLASSMGFEIKHVTTAAFNGQSSTLK